jgi:putative ABC transport system permease protein
MRLAFRQLIRQKSFAAAALVTLALGIGGPTTIFSVVHAVLLRPLPYFQPDRIVRFRIESRSPAGPVGFDALPATEALQWGAQSETLSSMALFNERALTLSTADGPFRLSGISATPNLFDLLGARPALGRAFSASSTDARQVVLSHATWLQFFKSDPDIAGKAVTFDGVPYRVTGVMPHEFRFPSAETAFWVPQVIEASGSRGMLLPAIARMKDGATTAAVVQEGTRALGDPGDRRIQQTLIARTLQQQMVGGVERMLWMLMAAVSVVFVIATVSIALLLLTRGAAREREFSIRLALGAGRGRLVRQLFLEGLVLAALGGLAGVIAAAAALKVLVRLAPPDLPRLQEASLDWQVLGFAVAVTLVTSLVFGILSAGRAIAIDPLRALGGSGAESRLVTGALPRRRLNLLAASQFALTMVLLVGAGLLIRSFVALALVDQGFDGRGALAMQINLPLSRYPGPAARMAFHERLLERLGQLDHVKSFGLISSMPNRQSSGRFDYNPVGVKAFPEPFSTDVVGVRMATDGFFEAMGIPLLAGRTFRATDTEGSEAVMVISERMARFHFQDRDPVGQLLYSGTGNRRVVGVVGDVKPIADDEEPAPAAYLPLRQSTGILEWFGTMNVIVRGKGAGEMRSLLLSLDPEMPAFNARMLDDEAASLVAGPRFSAALLTMFAGVALVMAAVGVYGVMAYSAAQRTREIGLRVALGATRGQVLRLIIRDGVSVVAGGLAVGLVAALWISRGLTSLLHDVTPNDPLAVASVTVLLSIVGVAAAYLPARRATRVSALSALRDDA